MSNEIATTDVLNNIAAMKGAFSQAGDDMGASVGQFMSFSAKTGIYTYGSNHEELEPGHKLLVDMPSTKRGWICWKDSEVADEMMIDVTAGRPPAKKDLPDHGPYETYEDGSSDGWNEQASVQFTDTVSGTLLLFKTSSKSGMSAMGQLMKDYATRVDVEINDDGLPLTPVVELDVNSFVPKKNKKVGKIYVPVFKIVDWIDPSKAKAVEGDGGSPDDYDDEPEVEVIQTKKEPAKRKKASPRNRRFD